MFGTWRAHFTLFSVMKLLVDTFTIATVQEYTKKYVRFFCKLWGFSLTKHLHVSASDYLTTPYSPVPNIRPGPNYRPDGDQWSKLIRDQDLFTDHMGLYQNF